MDQNGKPIALNSFSCTVILVILFLPAHCLAVKEKVTQRKHCKGIIEYVLPDKTRVDCLTSTHAIEYDKGQKWAESIGQSLYYSLQTGKRAGVVLILKNKKQYRYWIRLNSTIMEFKLPIDTWLVYDD